MKYLEKISYNQFKKDMCVFLNIPEVEKTLEREMDDFIKTILLSKPQNGHRNPIDVLTDYLNISNQEDRLKIVLALSNGSEEQLKRIFQAIFPARSFTEWKNIKDNTLKRIASFLINPLKERVFIPEFIRNSFCLPDNWIDLLSDKRKLKTLVQSSYKSKYAVKMGDAFEKNIVQIVENMNIKWIKGPVEIVDNKEVDIAIPHTSDPQILIMSSYSLTTSSAQSSRANEQARMYQDIQTHNRRKTRKNKFKILFINVIDGGGWLARVNDLHRMWEECDYCFCYSNVQQGLKKIFNHYKLAIK